MLEYFFENLFFYPILSKENISLTFSYEQLCTFSAPSPRKEDDVSEKSNAKPADIQFDGTGDIKVFLQKAEVMSKELSETKKRMFLASKLSGKAADFYRYDDCLL